jgi:hypothetical protein
MSSEPYLLGVLLLHHLQATPNTDPPQHNVSGPGVGLQGILLAGAGAMEAQPVSCQVAAPTQAQHVLPSVHQANISLVRSFLCYTWPTPASLLDAAT